MGPKRETHSISKDALVEYIRLRTKLQQWWRLSHESIRGLLRGLTWLLILQLMDQSVLPHYQHHDPTVINTDHEERANCRPFSRQTLICCDIGPLCISEGVFCVFSGRSRTLVGVRRWHRLFIWILFKKPRATLAPVPLFKGVKINMTEIKGTQSDMMKIEDRNNHFLGAVAEKSMLTFLFFKIAILSHVSGCWYLSGFECWHFWSKSWRCHTEGKDVKRVIHTYYIGVGYYWLGCLVKERLFLTFEIEVSCIFLFCNYIDW